jgi:hypothetical protein
VRLVGRDGIELHPSFHFENGTARLMLDERHFTPGFYTLFVTRTDNATGQSETASQEFAWGVLAMNTDKDRYHQNESAHIDFGVLDENGKIVCDAALTLAVTLPDGTREELSTAGGGIHVTGTCGRKEGGLLTPDYQTDLPLPLIGDYQLELTAVRPDATAHTTSTITSTLKVVTTTPYLISRTAATRLWPFAPSTMDIAVAFEQDFTGTITDVVPQGFSVLSATPSATIGTFPGGNDTGIAWTGSWHAGETAHFHYVYDAPDISPQFFLIGPLQMDGAAGHDQEMRSWEIANDDAGASATYRITSDVFPGGGAETARSNNYILSDTIGEPIVGFGSTAAYALNSGYRQTTQPALTSLSLGCPTTTTLGTITFSGQQTGSGTCTVTTDNPTGYSLAWTAGSNNANGLVGYWKFDETTGTTAYDDSGNGYDGTLTNGPTISTDVPSNFFSTRSLSFDGVNDYVEWPDANADAIFLGKTALTVSVWIKPLATESGKHWLEYGDGASTFSLEGSTSVASFYTNNGSAISTSLTVGAWNHIVLMMDGTNKKIFKNGVEVASTAFSSALTNGSLFRIGGRGATRNTNSDFDDLRIYSRALSSAEIQDLASKAPPGAMTASGSQLDNIPPYSLPATGGLVGHWRMDERTAGSTVADSSGQGNDGTPNGAGGANNLPQPSTSIPSGTNFRDSRSLNFDGTDDYVGILDANSLHLTTGMTLSAWIKPTDVANYRQIISKFGSSGNYSHEIMLAPTGELRMDVSGNGTNDQSLVTSGLGLTSGNWYHIAGTFNAGRVTLYVNGVQQATTTLSVTSLYPGTTNPSIGRDPAGSQFFKGNIDDARIYNRALSAAEVKALYNTPQTWNVTATGAGFGARLRSSSTDTDAKWGTDGSSDKWLNIGDGNYPVVTRSSLTATGGSTEIIQYRAEVGASKLVFPGLYQMTTVYTASAL